MSEQNTRAPLATARVYARRGWAVHPVQPGDKRPLLKDWSHQATTDPRTIEAWPARWPDANVGLACGPSGLIVVDLDVKGGADSPASWARLLAQLGFAGPATPAGRTPSGGRHLFFAAGDPPLGNSTGRLGPGIDTRGEGGYVLLPPSTLAGGRAYTREVSPQAEIEDKALDAVRRWQGTAKYFHGLTASDIGRFVRGLGSGEVRFYADQMVRAGVLVGHKTGRAVRYYLPAPEGAVDSRQIDNGPRAENVYGPADGGHKHMRSRQKRSKIYIYMSIFVYSSEVVMVKEVIGRTRRPRCGSEVTIRYKESGQTATRTAAEEPPAAGGLVATGGPSTMAPWHGQRVKIEDLPAFAARWGLVAVRGEWPEGEACPRLYFVDVQLVETSGLSHPGNKASGALIEAGAGRGGEAGDH